MLYNILFPDNIWCMDQHIDLYEIHRNAGLRWVTILSAIRQEVDRIFWVLIAWPILFTWLSGFNPLYCSACWFPICMSPFATFFLSLPLLWLFWQAIVLFVFSFDVLFSSWNSSFFFEDLIRSRCAAYAVMIAINMSHRCIDLQPLRILLSVTTRTPRQNVFSLVIHGHR